MYIYTNLKFEDHKYFLAVSVTFLLLKRHPDQGCLWKSLLGFTVPAGESVTIMAGSSLTVGSSRQADTVLEQ